MGDTLIVDLSPDRQVSVSTWRDGELPGGSAPEPVELGWSLDADALEDLRWYLEDYLRAPYGVYASRGPEVADKLRAWGEAAFAALFGSGPARDAYVGLRVRDRGPEVVLRSSSPALLGPPCWACPGS